MVAKAYMLLANDISINLCITLYFYKTVYMYV